MQNSRFRQIRRTRRELRGNMWCQFCEINSYHRRNMAKGITFLPDAWKAKHMACLSHIFCIFLLVLTDRFWKMESAFHFSELSIYFLSFLLLFCHLEKDCLKWLKIIPDKIKTRNTLEKFKNRPEIFNKVLKFHKRYIIGGDLHFFQIPGEGVLAAEENSTYISLYSSG